MHIKEVIETGAKISNDTNTLASALKGDNMKQGRWGELILEKVLELSGLRKAKSMTRKQDSVQKNLMQLFFYRTTKLYLLTQKHRLHLMTHI